MRGYRIVCLPWYDQGVAISLNRLDLLKQQFEPIKFTADLRLEILRQRAAVAGPQFVKPRQAIPPQRFVAGNPL